MFTIKLAIHDPLGHRFTNISYLNRVIKGKKTVGVEAISNFLLAWPQLTALQLMVGQVYQISGGLGQDQSTWSPVAERADRLPSVLRAGASSTELLSGGMAA